MKYSCPPLASLALAFVFAFFWIAVGARAAIETPSVQLAEKWIVESANNICGLSDAKMLSRPCKVEYDTLLRATPEMKRIRDEKIEESSSEGIQLRQAAVDRIRNAAERVRQAQGHCSVWKQIRHTDGRAIPDVTELVKAQL
jgi:hypothetical protein